jgi:tetratricopeptide (TPR) repeat protein
MKEGIEAKKSELQARYLQQQGYYDEALPYAHKALELWEKAGGSSHVGVFRSCVRLAELYLVLGAYAKANLYLQRAFESSRDVDAGALPFLDNLAALYASMGDHDKAEHLYQQTLRTYKRPQVIEEPRVFTAPDGSRVIEKTTWETSKNGLILSVFLASLVIILYVTVKVSRLFPKKAMAYPY